MKAAGWVVLLVGAFVSGCGLWALNTSTLDWVRMTSITMIGGIVVYIGARFLWLSD